MSHNFDVLIIGGGASGFFCAANLPKKVTVAILEAEEKPLLKVRASGGGRCNLSHRCDDIEEFLRNYPRGHKELLNLFAQFGPRDLVAWFEERGVFIEEEEGRLFPKSRKSGEIVDCLLKETKTFSILTKKKVLSLKKEKDFFIAKTENEEFKAPILLLATGGASQGYHFAASLGHQVIPPVPSLFGFKIKNFLLNEVAGLTLEPVTVSLSRFRLKERGSLLITHEGFSGPLIFKLSSRGARLLYEVNYKTLLEVDWLSDVDNISLEKALCERMGKKAKAVVRGDPLFNLPRGLWGALLKKAGISETLLWREMTREKRKAFLSELKNGSFCLSDLSEKGEFVKAGGVSLKEVHPKTLASRLHQGLYFSGEILDIDGFTGGYNLQAAWTTGYCVAASIVKVLDRVSERS